jgi:CelD/BcsL family acetyltransferase involved in cellulose biosynthesis
VNIHITNPLSDTRWDELVTRHPRASVFHQRGWLEALAQTYGYEPFVLTSTPAGKPLSDGIVLCRVSSWITGTRLVSLPFSDHCEPLLSDRCESVEFGDWLRAECSRKQWRYVELRPLLPVQKALFGLRQSRSYCFHELDLRPSLEQIFRGLHKDSIQRKIQRAEREGLSYEAGQSEPLVDEFYRLLLITRRRHQLLPQPRAWFRNLVKCMGNTIDIRLVRKNGAPVAAMLTLRHRTSVVYKYGCSDGKFHNLGGMPFLFWRLIEESKASGAEEIDFGRSDLNNHGLSVFKDRFGTTRKLLTYYRYWNTERAESTIGWDSRALRQLFCMLPDAAFSTAGRLLYRHMG